MDWGDCPHNAVTVLYERNEVWLVGPPLSAYVYDFLTRRIGFGLRNRIVENAHGLG